MHNDKIEILKKVYAEDSEFTKVQMFAIGGAYIEWWQDGEVKPTNVVTIAYEGVGKSEILAVSDDEKASDEFWRQVFLRSEKEDVELLLTSIMKAKTAREGHRW